MLLPKPVKVMTLFDTISKLVLGRSPARSGPQVSSQGLLAKECPLTILVAEDNPVNQRVISLQLERLGYTALIVSNGLEALAALQEQKFDAVFLDVQMPEMDGFTTAREICRIFADKERPRIIALTADAGCEDEEKCLAAGMDRFLTKPVRSQHLAAVLRQTFEGLKADPVRETGHDQG